MSKKICPVRICDHSLGSHFDKDAFICLKEKCQWWGVVHKETTQPHSYSNALTEPQEEYIMGCAIERIGR